jgi:hypothetical protein
LPIISQSWLRANASKRDFCTGTVIGLILGWLLASFSGEWRPAGNGRIVNSRTGQIRVVSTGENVEDYLKRIAEDEAVAREKAEQRAADAEAWWKRNPHLKPKDPFGGWGEDVLPPDIAESMAAEKERAARAAEAK